MDDGGFHDNCNPGLFTLSAPFPPWPWKSVKSLLASAGHQAPCLKPSPHDPGSSWWCFSFPPTVLSAGAHSASSRPHPSTPSHPWHPMPILDTLAISRLGQGGPTASWFLRRWLSGNPQVQIWCIYLEEKQRKPTPPTAHNGNTPFLHPLWQVPAALPHPLQVP